MVQELRLQLNFPQIPGGELSLPCRVLLQRGQLLGSFPWMLYFDLCLKWGEHKFIKLFQIMCFNCCPLFALELLLNFCYLSLTVIFCGRA